MLTVSDLTFINSVAKQGLLTKLLKKLRMDCDEILWRILFLKGKSD